MCTSNPTATSGTQRLRVLAKILLIFLQQFYEVVIKKQGRKHYCPVAGMFASIVHGSVIWVSGAASVNCRNPLQNPTAAAVNC